MALRSGQQVEINDDQIKIEKDLCYRIWITVKIANEKLLLHNQVINSFDYKFMDW